MQSEPQFLHDFGCTILGSGSKGNSSVIHGPKGNILLDAGFSARELLARLNRTGISPESISAMLITHEHSDHICGCRPFCERFGIPAYTTSETCRKLVRTKRIPENYVLITPGSSFELCGVQIDPFTIPHDVDAVAYTFCAGVRKIGYATDLGCLTILTMSKLQNCCMLVLESNYEPDILRNSGRPIYLQRRIMGKQGHLSNDDALKALGDLICSRTRHVVLAHLSTECNDSQLVLSRIKDRLIEIHRENVSFCVASQTDPLPTFWISE